MTALHALSPAAHALRSTALAALLGCTLSGAALAVFFGFLLDRSAARSPSSPPTPSAPPGSAGAPPT